MIDYRTFKIIIKKLTADGYGFLGKEFNVAVPVGTQVTMEDFDNGIEVIEMSALEECKRQRDLYLDDIMSLRSSSVVMLTEQNKKAADQLAEYRHENQRLRECIAERVSEGLTTYVGEIGRHSPVAIERKITAMLTQALVRAGNRHHRDCDSTCVDACPIDIRRRALGNVATIREEYSERHAVDP